MSNVDVESFTPSVLLVMEMLLCLDPEERESMMSLLKREDHITRMRDIVSGHSTVSGLDKVCVGLNIFLKTKMFHINEDIEIMYQINRMDFQAHFAQVNVVASVYQKGMRTLTLSFQFTDSRIPSLFDRDYLLQKIDKEFNVAWENGVNLTFSYLLVKDTAISPVPIAEQASALYNIFTSISNFNRGEKNFVRFLRQLLGKMHFHQKVEPQFIELLHLISSMKGSPLQLHESLNGVVAILHLRNTTSPYVLVKNRHKEHYVSSTKHEVYQQYALASKLQK